MNHTSKLKLSVYTNMPTPYQLDFFDGLKELFELHVVYFTAKEADRQWTLPTSGIGYRVTVLQNGSIAKIAQRRFPSFHYSPDINKVIAADEADFFIVNGTYWSPNVTKVISGARKKGKWIAYWAEPVFPVRSPLKFRVKKMLLRTVLNKTNCILAIGKKATASFRAYGYKHPIHELPYNINNSLFEAANLTPEQLADLRERYKIHDHFVFLSSGSLIHRKGMDTVIKAFKQASEATERAMKLLIIGDGDQKESLRQLAADNKNIVLLGFQEKEMVPYWYNLADAFVFASRYDGWALVINEALAAGKPVIASTATGAATDRLNNDNAFLIDPEDVNGFANAMIKLANDRSLGNQLAIQTKEIARELSSAYNAQKIYDICRHAE